MATRFRRDTPATLLVPTDFSPGASQAVRRAALLPLRKGGQVHIVHVLPSGSMASRVRRIAVEALKEAADEARKAAAFAGLPAPDVVTGLLAGDAYVEIIRHARSIDADLIVIGRKGAGARLRQAIGSTAARVVRMSDLPVLIVGTRPTRSYQRPLMASALDPSERGLGRLLGGLVGDDATVQVVHAYTVPFTGLLAAGTEDRPTDHHLKYRIRAERLLARHLKVLGRPGLRLQGTAHHGDPRQVILEEADRIDSDLVAVGTHGRSGIAYVLLGSVAEWVAVGTTRDVLMARPVRFTFREP